MKNIIMGLIVLGSLSTFAEQNILCRQINKNGSVKKNGVELNLTMTSKKSGYASLTGLKDDFLNEQVVNSVSQGTAINDSKFTTFFLVPKNDDGMLDIQLQFDSSALNKEFSNLEASYVIGSDSANPETDFSFGYDMVCDSQII